MKSFVGAVGPYYYPEDEIFGKLEKLKEETSDIDNLNKFVKEMIDDLMRKRKAYDLCEKFLKEN